MGPACNVMFYKSEYGASLYRSVL